MLSPKFKEYYRKLNKEQKEAVDTIEGPVMVIAGPGTGKTTVLTLRIARILEKTDTPPSGILAITYTDAGVKAMRTKLRDFIGTQADDVHIHTFHSFAVSVIRDYPDHFPHLSGNEPLTDIEAKEIIKEILELKQFKNLRPAGRPELYVAPILSAISESKKDAYTPEMLKAFAEDEIKKIRADDAEYSTRGKSKGKLKAEAEKRIQKCEQTILLFEIYEKYEERKQKQGKIDFDDMIFELKLSLRKDELLLRLLQEEFLYMLVDEHQDTNDSQNSLILMIAEFFETPNVFIVGDEKQAIYRFQGASVENFLKFQRVWRGVKLIQLDQSFRSQQKILDAAYKLIEHNYEEGQYSDLRVWLKSGAKEREKPIVVASAENIIDAEEYLTEKVKEILKNESKAEIALIVRTNNSVSRLKRLFENRGIKAESVRNVDIFTHPSGRLFFDLLSAVYDPLDSESLGKTVATGLWGLSFDEQRQALKEIRSGGITKIGKISKKLNSLRDSILSGDPVGFLFEVARASGYEEKISLEPERTEIWRGILKFAETILRSRENSSDTSALIKELLSNREEALERQVKIFSGDPEARVKIMTAHGSKGLEFDYVFIPYATESFWMKKAFAEYFVLPFKKVSAEDQIKDSRRLFYVALTRARRHVEILTHTEMEGGETDLSLRFIEELGEENIERTDIKHFKKSVLTKIKTKKSRIEEEIIQEARRVLKENGLSVTALNHFIECPNRFIYRSILKVPDSPSMTSEKGTAMHNALAFIFRSSEKNLKKIEKILRKKAFEYLDQSFLKKFEIENIKDDLKKEIPFIVQGMEEISLLHRQSGHSSERNHVEKNTVGELEIPIDGGKKIKTPIHGRLDLIREAGDEIKVIDFKTKGAMSPAQIKGETKSAGRLAGGAYFRQLVFYVLLLSQNSKYGGKKIIPALLFLTPDKKGKIKKVTLPVSEDDILKVKREIGKLVKSIYSGEILSQKCDDPKCHWCAFKQIAVL